MVAKQNNLSQMADREYYGAKISEPSTVITIKVAKLLLGET